MNSGNMRVMTEAVERVTSAPAVAPPSIALPHVIPPGVAPRPVQQTVVLKTIPVAQATPFSHTASGLSSSMSSSLTNLSNGGGMQSSLPRSLSQASLAGSDSDDGYPPS